MHLWARHRDGWAWLDGHMLGQRGRLAQGLHLWVGPHHHRLLLLVAEWQCSSSATATARYMVLGMVSIPTALIITCCMEEVQSHIIIMTLN